MLAYASTSIIWEVETGRSRSSRTASATWWVPDSLGYYKTLSRRMWKRKRREEDQENKNIRIRIHTMFTLDFIIAALVQHLAFCGYTPEASPNWKEKKRQVGRSKSIQFHQRGAGNITEWNLYFNHKVSSLIKGLTLKKRSHRWVTGKGWVGGNKRRGGVGVGVGIRGGGGGSQCGMSGSQASVFTLGSLSYRLSSLSQETLVPRWLHLLWCDHEP